MTITERIEIPGAHGGRLAARIEMPAGTPSAFALFAHCFTCTKDYKAVVRISRELAGHGVAVCRFDFTGLGESEGDFAETNFSSNLEDLEAAAQFLRERYQAPHLLIGHSLGGAAMLAVASRIPESKAVVTIGAPSDTEHLSQALLQMAPELEERGEARVTIAGRSFLVRKQLLDDLKTHRMRSYVADLDRPLLIVHSPVDQTVGIDHAMRLFEIAEHPKSFLAVDGADHLLSRQAEDWRTVAGVIVEWARRYLVIGANDSDALSTSLATREVLVSGGAAGYATSVRAGRHSLKADEPPDVGGTDTGPNPYSFLLAALGTCKVITMRMYADRKGWALGGTTLRLRHSRIHASDCEDCKTEDGRIDRIDVELRAEGRLSEQQMSRLVEISDRCPVQRTLQGEVSIRTTAV